MSDGGPSSTSTPDEALVDAFVEGEPQAVAVARARACVLFSRFLRHGVEAETFEHAVGLDELAEPLERWRGPGGFAADAAAADHQRVLGFEVPPLGSVVLDPDGRAGGAITQRAHDLLSAAGVPVDPARESADHLAVLLDGLAFLASAEAQAWQDGQDARAASAATHAMNLARDLGGPVWPGLAEAVAREEEPFFAALLGMLGSLLDDVAGERARGAPAVGPSLPELLDAPETGLAQVAEHLSVAARSGLHLSRGAVARAGRRVGLPSGFGTRRDRLLTLLQSAAEHERWAATVDALTEPVRMAKAFHRERGIEAPRLDATLAGLARLRVAPVTETPPTES